MKQRIKMKYRILLVDDEDSIRQTLKINLELEEYEVIEARNGAEAVKIFREQKFHLIILDVMMPVMDGFETCKQLRMQNADIGILFLTAADTNEHKIKGLQIGADDYIVKPFNTQEFLLRVKAILKRTNSEIRQEIKQYQFENNNINFENYTCTNWKNEKVELTKKEILLLKLLFENNNKVVSRDEILHYVWGYDVYPNTRTIDNFIVNFRKYFEQNAAEPKHFISVRGVGYKFIA